MGIFSAWLRAPSRRATVRTPVAPVEIGREAIDPTSGEVHEWPDQTADQLEALNAEGERRLFEQFGRETRKRGNRP